jgi:hypothetical protein
VFARNIGNWGDEMTVTIEAGKFYNTDCGGEWLFKDRAGKIISERTPPTEPAWIEWHGGECPIKSDRTMWQANLRGQSVVLCSLGKEYWATVENSIESYRITENHEPAEPTCEPIDMSQNRVTWEMLTDAEQSALRAWRGIIEWWNYASKSWTKGEVDDMPGDEVIFRTVAAPVITEEKQDISTNSGHLVTVTLQLQDGKPISGTVKV